MAQHCQPAAQGVVGGVGGEPCAVTVATCLKRRGVSVGTFLSVCQNSAANAPHTPPGPPHLAQRNHKHQQARKQGDAAIHGCGEMRRKRLWERKNNQTRGPTDPVDRPPSKVSRCSAPAPSPSPKPTPPSPLPQLEPYCAAVAAHFVKPARWGAHVAPAARLAWGVSACGLPRRGTPPQGERRPGRPARGVDKLAAPRALGVCDSPFGGVRECTNEAAKGCETKKRNLCYARRQVSRLFSVFGQPSAPLRHHPLSSTGQHTVTLCVCPACAACVCVGGGRGSTAISRRCRCNRRPATRRSDRERPAQRAESAGASCQLSLSVDKNHFFRRQHFFLLSSTGAVLCASSPSPHQTQV